MDANPRYFFQTLWNGGLPTEDQHAMLAMYRISISGHMLNSQFYV